MQFSFSVNSAEQCNSPRLAARSFPTESDSRRYVTAGAEREVRSTGGVSAKCSDAHYVEERRVYPESHIIGNFFFPSPVVDGLGRTRRYAHSARAADSKKT